MARLVADLLSLSRIELNEHTPPTGSVDLAPLLHGVADTLELKAERQADDDPAGCAAAGGSGGAAMALADLPQVIGDDDELTQVFQNLIDNAIKYGRPGRSVRVAGWLAEPAAIDRRRAAAADAGQPRRHRRDG